MNDAEQVAAYANADFAEPHDRFVALLRERFPDLAPKTILDLGCGPGDISRRLARAFPKSHVVGIDGAPAMLEAGREWNRREALASRVELRLAYLPDDPTPGSGFDAVVSNSLLHHLKAPDALWSTVRKTVRPNTAVFVMDLMRPASPAEARSLVERYASEEPRGLQRDFENSLHAAYRPDEVRAQLAAARLESLTVEAVSDRHLIVFGMASAMVAP